MSGFYNPENWKPPIMGVSIDSSTGKDLTILTVCAKAETLEALAEAMLAGADAIMHCHPSAADKGRLLRNTGERLLRDIAGG